MSELKSQGIKVDGMENAIRDLKEQMCSISMNYEFDRNNTDDPLSQEDRKYELPGGKIIEVNKNTRFKATEILFDPTILGKHISGIAKMAYQSIEKCDNDLKNSCLYSNIILAGGSTLMPGFKERFEAEIKSYADGSADTDIKVFADLHRKNAAWIGGSMISSFSTFRDLAVTKEEYDNGDTMDKPLAILKKSVN